jgi:hypothetical protein
VTGTCNILRRPPFTNPRLTMALPYLAPLVTPLQVPKKSRIRLAYGEEMVLYLPLNQISSKLGLTIADPPKLRPTKERLLSKPREMI